MALTKEESKFIRQKIRAYEDTIATIQDAINFLEDKLAGKHELSGMNLVVGVTHDIEKYGGSREREEDEEQK